MTQPRRPERILFIGQVHACASPLLLRTLLGSCVAVCLFDPVARVGGMNHFALPNGPDRRTHTDRARFGLPAMIELLGALMAAGAVRHRLLATIIGGGHLLSTPDFANDLPRRNIDFARRFLARERIAIVAEDVGGHYPRQVRFHTDTGVVVVTRGRTSAGSRGGLRRVLVAALAAPDTAGDRH
ncbi:MAG: chemotaxis protein CheD [Deltaproteobacteria bacterium]|nr:chemotaxis protein CheD [Deltaproteobacteria bacterium]MBI3388473.1 chemotaxis protein CheD [Deltaproteobacteria bacterium]